MVKSFPSLAQIVYPEVLNLSMDIFRYSQDSRCGAEIKDVLASELNNRLYSLKEVCSFWVGLWQVMGLKVAFSNTLIFWIKLQTDVITIISISVVLSVINTLEVLVGRWLFQRLLPDGHMFNRSADAFRFILFAVCISLFSLFVCFNIQNWIELIKIYNQSVLALPLDVSLRAK